MPTTGDPILTKKIGSYPSDAYLDLCRVAVENTVYFRSKNLYAGASTGKQTIQVYTKSLEIGWASIRTMEYSFCFAGVPIQYALPVLATALFKTGQLTDEQFYTYNQDDPDTLEIVIAMTKTIK